MKIGINAKKKTLTVDGETYHFEYIDLSNDEPFWKVTQTNGEVLIVDFGQEIGSR